MALTKEDLQAIRELMREENAPIKADIAGLKANVTELEEGMQTVKTALVRIEIEQFPRITAALDGIVGGIEKNVEQDRRISFLENKVENYGNRIKTLEYIAKAK